MSWKDCKQVITSMFTHCVTSRQGTVCLRVDHIRHVKFVLPLWKERTSSQCERLGFNPTHTLWSLCNGMFSPAIQTVTSECHGLNTSVSVHGCVTVTHTLGVWFPKWSSCRVCLCSEKKITQYSSQHAAENPELLSGYTSHICIERFVLKHKTVMYLYCINAVYSHYTSPSLWCIDLHISQQNSCWKVTS